MMIYYDTYLYSDSLARGCGASARLWTVGATNYRHYAESLDILTINILGGGGGGGFWEE